MVGQYRDRDVGGFGTWHGGVSRRNSTVFQGLLENSPCAPELPVTARNVFPFPRSLETRGERLVVG